MGERVHSPREKRGEPTQGRGRKRFFRMKSGTRDEAKRRSTGKGGNSFRNREDGEKRWGFPSVDVPRFHGTELDKVRSPAFRRCSGAKAGMLDWGSGTASRNSSEFRLQAARRWDKKDRFFGIANQKKLRFPKHSGFTLNDPCQTAPMKRAPHPTPGHSPESNPPEFPPKLAQT